MRELGRANLLEERGDVETAVDGRKGAEAARCFLELPLASDPVPAARLVPRDGDVDEALEEVPLARIGGAPALLEHLVGGEVLGALDQLEAALVAPFKRFRHGTKP